MHNSGGISFLGVQSRALKVIVVSKIVSRILAVWLIFGVVIQWVERGKISLAGSTVP